MAFKINNNHGQWWRASDKAWTTWARATRYKDDAAAERAFERLDAAGVRPVGIFPSGGEPSWSRNGARA